MGKLLSHAIGTHRELLCPANETIVVRKCHCAHPMVLSYRYWALSIRQRPLGRAIVLCKMRNLLIELLYPVTEAWHFVLPMRPSSNLTIVSGNWFFNLVIGTLTIQTNPRSLVLIKPFSVKNFMVQFEFVSYEEGSL